MLRKVIILCAAACALGVYSQEPEDSTKVTELKELTVMGERAWIGEDGRVNIIPSKQEKRISNSAGSLIKALHIPMLKSDGDNSISTIDGRQVSIFINGEPATDTDLATFWPMDVRRVEYIIEPADPKFLGAGRVVNFIVEKYLAGGVTKIRGYYTSPRFIDGNLASKLVYKKMTYGMSLMSHYDDNDKDRTYGTRSYKDIYYNGKKYDRIDNLLSETLNERSNYTEFAFNAKYTGSKVNATHTFGLVNYDTPNEWYNSTDDWTPELFGSEQSSGSKKTTSLVPQLSGNYYLTFSDRFIVIANWGYKYGRNTSSGWTQMGTLDKITNATKEDSHTAKLGVSPYYLVRPNLSFQLIASASFDWFRTHYTGSANESINQNRQEIKSSLRMVWLPRKNIGLVLLPGFNATIWNIGGIKEHTVNPSAEASLNWGISKRVSINGSLNYGLHAPEAAQSNPVMVQNNELEWTVGNPYLKSMNLWYAGISGSYITNDWLSMSLGANYRRINNDIYTLYTPAPAEYGGIIKQTANLDPSDWLRAYYSISASFFDRDLSISLRPEFTYERFHGPLGQSVCSFRLNGDIDYTIGDFNLNIWYDPSYTGLDYGGMEKSWANDKWNFGATYGNGNWHITMRVEDIFHKYHRGWTNFITPNYTSMVDTYRRGRTFKLGITYTFGYGKKVDRNIDINSLENAKSSVL